MASTKTWAEKSADEPTSTINETPKQVVKYDDDADSVSISFEQNQTNGEQNDGFQKDTRRRTRNGIDVTKQCFPEQQQQQQQQQYQKQHKKNGNQNKFQQAFTSILTILCFHCSEGKTSYQGTFGDGTNKYAFCWCDPNVWTKEHEKTDENGNIIKVPARKVIHQKKHLMKKHNAVEVYDILTDGSAVIRLVPFDDWEKYPHWLSYFDHDTNTIVTNKNPVPEFIQSKLSNINDNNNNNTDKNVDNKNKENNTKKENDTKKEKAKKTVEKSSDPREKFEPKQKAHKKEKEHNNTQTTNVQVVQQQVQQPKQVVPTASIDNLCNKVVSVNDCLAHCTKYSLLLEQLKKIGLGMITEKKNPSEKSPREWDSNKSIFGDLSDVDIKSVSQYIVSTNKFGSFSPIIKEIVSNLKNLISATEKEVEDLEKFFSE